MEPGATPFSGGVMTRTGLPHDDLAEHAEVLPFHQTVGNVEVETVRHEDLGDGVLVLPLAVHLLVGAPCFQGDARVPVLTLGLADGDETHAGL